MKDYRNVNVTIPDHQFIRKEAGNLDTKQSKLFRGMIRMWKTLTIKEKREYLKE